ncbi:serine/threonine-protein kinase [Stutzerimonas chloritidismutans]|jgi:tetratricopeptide (TPR) repeat protein|uniref:serine/threonine-protein kinase n=1 Tax=Stutzerimonas stutzeri subgroup TaxID=578833 RepID=UPI0006275FC4|nr:serine/threonine-protein kinase [Stutzerimonas kunmingensis]KKJ95238.1 protein kinase [Stutzerimonas stutzeri]MAF88328.1 serine/threonine protein kinase [Pseudomonas sp.]MAK87040.1 serine/threonine protein kinase [Pseudomonas sp.]MBD3876192.1 protein kinase [Stutzerimonas kunmingensis]HCH78278.1 serine/threonine protein kinase [Pseudomonas sp.]|tara:strand:- start:2303 stop:3850 length:1548 start_codon:yes stop_codon:yes gene_type:complete
MHRMLEIPGYRLHKRLGKGGMAEVYLATQLSLDREVAVKVLLRTEDAAFTERFIQEGHIVASLRHPAIITIHDIGQIADGRHYLAMEYLGGGDLAQHRGIVFSPSRALDIIRQLAGGLAVVHDGGLVHRDVKPANILFRDDGSVVLTDFGVAKAVELDNELTHFGIAVGSPAYSSPEQAQCQPLDARSDIYSLGVILAEMLTGANAFRASSYPQTVLNHLQMPLPQLPPALAPYQPLLDRMLAKQPDERFGNCRELLAAIDTLTEPDMDQTRIAPAAFIEAPTRRRRRRRGIGRWAVIGAALIVTVAALAAGGYQWLQYSRINDYLTRAEARLDEGQLTAPAFDNADYYYRQALRLDSDNVEALDGIRRVLDARIAQALELAAQRLANDQLLQPAEDSAVHYYQQVLGWLPENEVARNGLVQVSERYVELAEAAYGRREFALALEYIQQGLEATPDYAPLLALHDAHAQRVAKARAPRPVKRTTASTSRAAPTNTQTSQAPANPVKRLWNRIFNQ